MPTLNMEREAKLLAGKGFVLPDLTELGAGLRPAPADVRHLDAAYYDSEDLRLARAGVTLRRRTGERGPQWTLKLPAGGGHGALTRHEYTFDGEPEHIPAEARDLVRGYLRGRPLREVLRVHTDRTAVRLLDANGTAVVEFADDVVVPGNGRRGGFHEVEVELLNGTDAALLDAAVARLVAAGARREPALPKAIRLLGASALAPAEVVVPALSDKPTLVEVIRHALAGAVAELIGHDAGVRLGEDPEDVHKFRVATRRLRSDLKTFAPLLAADQVAALRAELAWLGDAVGAVRDADVLFELLRRNMTGLPDVDQVAADVVLDRLADEREGERERMLAALRTDRYDRLLEALVAAAAEPPFVDGGNSHRPRRFTTAVVNRQWRRLVGTVAMVSEPPTDDELHRVRILAKRCRYAAEAARPVLGAPAASLAKDAERIQTVLGDYHDTVVARDWLRVAAEDEPALAVVAGELIAGQRAEGGRLRGDWPAVWHAVSARGPLGRRDGKG